MNLQEAQDRIQEISQMSIKAVNMNQECYVGWWVLQNQDKDIDDYTMCHQQCFDGGEVYTKFWMEKK